MSADGHGYNFYHTTLCLGKDCRTFKENYVLYERNLYAIFLKLMKVWKVNFFWRNKRTEELCIRPFYSNEFLCLFLSPCSYPLSFWSWAPERSSYLSVFRQRRLCRGKLSFLCPLYTQIVLLEHLYDFWIWTLSLNDTEQRGETISTRSLHPEQSQYSQVSVTLKIQCKGIFLLVWTWTHLPKPHAHHYTHTCKSSGLSHCILEIVPWDFKKGLCGVVSDT